MINKIIENKKYIIVIIILIVISLSAVYILKNNEKETNFSMFTIEIDETQMYKTSVNYSPEYKTSISIELDSKVKFTSNVENAKYYSTDDSVVTVGVDGWLNIHSKGEATIYAAESDNSSEISNYIKVVVK